jgi:hypothetical protein
VSLAVSIGAETISVYADGEFYQVDATHPNYTSLLEELRKQPRDTAAILELVEIPAFIAKITAGRVQVGLAGVMFNGEPVGGYMADRLVAMCRDNLEVSSWASFMDNLMDNPAPGVREDLYKWMEAGKMPITEDGCLLGFKKIRQDYTDVHSGQFSNKPGSVLEMDRKDCDPSRENTCSTGFHFCSAGYLSQFGGQKVVVVKINPRDVTAIPSDYHNQKARCCKYVVLSELTNESAARHKVWSENNVLNLEDARELPEVLVPRAAKAVKDIQPAAERTVGPAPTDDLAVDAAAVPAPAAKAPAKAKKAPAAKAPKAAKAVAPATPAPATGSAAFTTGGGTSYTVAELQALIAQHGSKAAAARAMGIPATTLKGWVRKF